MEITIKESMLIRKCLNDYVLENKLDYDKSPLFMGLMTKLKDFEGFSVEDNKLFRKAIEEEAKINPNETNMHNAITKARIEQNKDIRNSLKKELKKYSIQTTCNEKILELMESENKMKEKTINKSLLSKISKNDIIELMMLNKKGDK